MRIDVLDASSSPRMFRGWAHGVKCVRYDGRTHYNEELVFEPGKVYSCSDDRPAYGVSGLHVYQDIWQAYLFNHTYHMCYPRFMHVLYDVSDADVRVCGIAARRIAVLSDLEEHNNALPPLNAAFLLQTARRAAELMRDAVDASPTPCPSSLMIGASHTRTCARRGIGAYIDSCVRFLRGDRNYLFSMASFVYNHCRTWVTPDCLDYRDIYDNISESLYRLGTMEVRRLEDITLIAAHALFEIFVCRSSPGLRLHRLKELYHA